jgi:hypothetical protein
MFLVLRGAVPGASEKFRNRQRFCRLRGALVATHTSSGSSFLKLANGLNFRRPQRHHACSARDGRQEAHHAANRVRPFLTGRHILNRLNWS